LYTIGRDKALRREKIITKAIGELP